MNDIKDPEQIYIKTTLPRIYRAVKLDKLVSRKVRVIFLRLSSFFVFLGLMVFGFLRTITIIPKPSFFATNDFFINFLSFAENFNFSIIYAVLILMASLFLTLLFLEFFYVSSLKPNVVFIKNDQAFRINFDTAFIFYSSGFLSDSPQFSSKKFHKAILGGGLFDFILLRLGAASGDYSNFIGSSDGRSLDKAEFMDEFIKLTLKKNKNIIGISEILEALYLKDEDFKKFLFDLEVDDEDLAGAASWMGGVAETQRAGLFIWEKASLSRIPGMAKDLGFGYTYELDKYSKEITGRRAPLHLEPRRKEITAIEDALSKSGEANALFVADDGSGKHTVIEGLAKMIREGRVVPAIEHKRMIELDIESIVASAKSKGNFEALVIKIMEDAIRAGNIILVLEDLNHSIKSSNELGSDFISLIEPYIAGSRIQVIATADRSGFNRNLSRSGKVIKLFETIEMEEVSPAKNLVIAEEVALGLEAISGKMFTYQALKKVLEVADRYVVEGVMPEKAVNLLDELAYANFSEGKRIIFAKDVESFISRKTNIPLGEAHQKEKDLLLKLEDYLHERIVDQEEAIAAISETLRRSRSGLRDKNKPIGSFLFLGPTGVGKTETAKALADLYFQGEEAMVRFDMSEYQGEDGFKKLIGSFETGEPGMLVTRVRERPYGIFLFDELEKSSKDILNLFLQILDEGFFTDSVGKRIFLRETLIIATSNAGANLIWDMIKEGKIPSDIKGKVIDAIRQEGKFSPELLNRFDAMVIYKPLTREHLVKIAELMLKELAKRLEEKDITFELSPVLINKVVEIGYDPVMGARPMRRAIADKIEGVIAKKILKGELKRGAVFKFTDEEAGGL